MGVNTRLKELYLASGNNVLDFNDALDVARAELDTGSTPEEILADVFGIYESDYEMDLLRHLEDQ